MIVYRSYMGHKMTPPNMLSRKTAHTDDISLIAEEVKKKIQTDSENPAFGNLTNNPVIIEEKSQKENREK